MMYAVAVQNTETLELDLIGPYETEAKAQLVRDSFAIEMDARYEFLSVFSVWVLPLRDMNTALLAHRSRIDMFTRCDPWARTLNNEYELDQP